MEQAIREFNKQFAWKPAVVNADRLPRAKKFVVGGMGGSHLGAGLLAGWKPELDIVIHRDYGLPILSDAEERFFIASSYSGNTEETIDFAKTALKKGYVVATISVGGKLLEFAQKNKLPHIVFPNTKIQPRSALGFAMRALAALIGDSALQRELAKLASALKPSALEGKGGKLAQTLRGKVPVVYSSTRNQAIAYNWKIKFNETGKIPAFYNVIPELNHNEMTGFSAEGGPASGGDVSKEAAKLCEIFHFIFLTDSADHPQNQKRMRVCKNLYEDRGLSVTEVALEGKTALEKMFTSLLIADWTALHLSKIYGTEAEQVPMVEEFKKLIV